MEYGGLPLKYSVICWAITAFVAFMHVIRSAADIGAAAWAPPAMRRWLASVARIAFEGNADLIVDHLATPLFGVAVFTQVPHRWPWHP